MVSQSMGASRSFPICSGNEADRGRETAQESARNQSHLGSSGDPEQ